MGIGGPVTYKKSTLPEVVQKIDLEHIILETDAPFLPPVPYRGKRNESAYIKIIAECLADLKSVSLADIAVATTANAKKIFAKNSFAYTTV